MYNVVVQFDSIPLVVCTAIPPEPLKGDDRVIFFCHGNGTDIGQMAPGLRDMAKRTGLIVVAWEYPGYGLTRGKMRTTAHRIREWGERAYDTMVEALGPNIILYGHSIGSGVACHLARARPAVGLVLQSAFTSITDIASALVSPYLWYVTPRIFDNLDNIGHVTCPILFLHGKRDTLIPYTHTLALDQHAVHAASTRVVLAPYSTHNDWFNDTDFYEPLHAFLHS